MTTLKQQSKSLYTVNKQQSSKSVYKQTIPQTEQVQGWLNWNLACSYEAWSGGAPAYKQ